MQYTGTQKQEIGMGALCKFFPELEINTVRNSANKYFCDVGAIGLLNKDKKTNKYRLKCTGGRLDKKNRIVRLGKDSSGKYTGSKVGQKDDFFYIFHKFQCTVKCAIDRGGSGLPRNKLTADFECIPVFSDNGEMLGAKAVYDAQGFQRYQEICGSGCLQSQLTG